MVAVLDLCIAETIVARLSFKTISMLNCCNVVEFSNCCNVEFEFLHC